MLGLTSGELFLVLLLVGAVVSARFWPALGEAIAVRLGSGPQTTTGPGPGSGPQTTTGLPPAPGPHSETGGLPKSERTSDTDST